LYTVQDELGERPIDALTSGRHHRVNRIASTLAF
ncbi:MAG: transcriptional regulator, partial [Actinomyces sp.]|nr:transcriptional regulator [Actinomyces sp.]